MACSLADAVWHIEGSYQKERLFLIALAQKVDCILSKSFIIMSMQVFESESMFAWQGIGIYVPFSGVSALITGFFHHVA